MEIARHYPKLKKNPFYLHSKHDTPASIWGFRSGVVQDSFWGLVLRHGVIRSGLSKVLITYSFKGQ